MQTDTNAKRYMVCRPGSKMAVHSQTMRVFDTLVDAMEHAHTIRARTVWELSPVKPPRKIPVDY